MKYRALVLSGGASLGAFQAGFLIGERRKYDAVFGASIGALNGAFVAQDDLEGLDKVWCNIILDRNKAFLSDVIGEKGNIRIGRAILKLLFDWPFLAIADSKPFLKTIQENISVSKIGVPFFFGLTSMNDFQYYPIEAKKLKDHDLHKALLASASVPSIFEPVSSIDINELDSIYYASDGGISSGSSLSDCVRYLKSINANADEWEIDIIRTRPRRVVNRPNPKNIIQMIFRMIEISLLNNEERDLKIFIDRNEMKSFTSFNYRHIEPTIDLGSSLDFSGQSLYGSFQHGLGIAGKYVQIERF